jgi:transcriptional regulator with XRE-family HTH domain
VTNTSDGIGASVRLRRVEAGIRQDHLAARVGISASHLSRFERGMRDVSVTTLEAIVRALVELGGSASPAKGEVRATARRRSGRARSSARES